MDPLHDASFQISNTYRICDALTQTAGADWVKQRSASFAWFHDITFTNENNGWIVGSGGTMLTTTDGGTTWTPFPRFTSDNLVEIHFSEAKVGWILCQRDIYSRGSNAVSYLRKTIDGGLTWENVEFENGGRERVAKLLFDGKGSAIAVGEGGIFYRLSEDGKSWKRSISSIKYLLLGGDFVDGAFGAIVGAAGTVMFTDDYGVTWQNATLLGKKDAKFTAVFFAEQKYGGRSVPAGRSSLRPAAAGSGGHRRRALMRILLTFSLPQTAMVGRSAIAERSFGPQTAAGNGPGEQPYRSPPRTRLFLQR
ncbi:MAG: hypothetical protein IPP63_06055 [Chloracidobacterium sp.]|nr:hypothetical protein [Chloracidobacterium sp.]